MSSTGSFVNYLTPKSTSVEFQNEKSFAVRSKIILENKTSTLLKNENSDLKTKLSDKQLEK